MRRLIALLTCALLAGCSGVIKSSPDAGPVADAGPTGPLNLPLDQVVAEVRIVHSSDDTQALVTAHFTNTTQQAVVLKGGQAVSVGRTGGTLTALVGPDSTGAYTVSLTSADAYDVKVNEPSRGVITSTVNAPGRIAITSPGPLGNASLSGFTTTWTPPATDATALVTLDQASSPAVHTDFQLTNDPGTKQFVANDLINYAQGTPMVLTVTVTRHQSGVQGFSSSSVELQRSATENVTPAP